jgi:pimeloyl-ACP methyl ester carboxylesterase
MAITRIEEEINQPRRRLVGAAAVTAAAVQLGIIGSAAAQPGKTKRSHAIKPGTHTSFAPLKQIDAGVLNIGYAEVGPANGPVAVLLHGWPYDIYAFVDVAPILASAGYRVIVPYVRGYGTTRFLSADTPRNGQQSAVAVDVIALMDALKIEKATIAGFDWGARSADIVAALWPERCKALVSVSGYLIGSQAAGKVPLPPKAELQWWYQYYFATNAARLAMRKIGVTSPSSSGSSPRRSGTSMTRPSIAPRRPSTTRITSPSWSITIAGGSGSPTAKPNTTIWKSGWPRAR